MHSARITAADRSALENLWGDAGSWVADTWTRLNADHFDGRLRYHGVVFGLTPHGHALGHTHGSSKRITLHPALLDPQGDAWKISDRHAADVLLHEMVHMTLFDQGKGSGHNGQPWCDEIMRITPQLGMDPVKAAPVKCRRINGKVKRAPLDGHLSRDQMARWPHTIRPEDYYSRDGRVRVLI